MVDVCCNGGIFIPDPGFHSHQQKAGLRNIVGDLGVNLCVVAGDVGHVEGLNLRLTVYDDWRTPINNAYSIADGNIVIFTSPLDAIDRAFSATSQREGALAFVLSREVRLAVQQLHCATLPLPSALRSL